MWIKKTLGYMVGDYLNEGGAVDRIWSWLKTSGLEEYMPQADRDWIEEADNAPLTVLAGVARGHAKRWLVSEWDDLEEHQTNFKFVNAYMIKIIGPSAVDQDYSVEESSIERILEVARWARFDETACWLRRVAVVLQDAGHHERAIEMFKEATELGQESAESWQALGTGYWTYGVTEKSGAEEYALVMQGVSHLETAVDLFKKRAAAEGTSPEEVVKACNECTNTTARIALYCRHGHDIDKCALVYEEVLSGWEQMSAEDDRQQRLGVCFYLGALYDNGKHDGGIRVLQRIVNHPRATDTTFALIYSEWVSEADTLFRLCYQTQRSDVLETFWRRGKQILAQTGAKGETGAARWYLAQATVRLQPDHMGEAIALLKAVVADEELSTPANQWNWIIDAAERELAREYFQKAFEGRENDRWGDLGRYAHELYELVKLRDPGSKSVSFKASSASLVLAAWNRVNSRTLHARQIARPLLEQNLELLYDTDKKNDAWAVSRICDALLAASDYERAITAHRLQASIRVFGNEMDLVDFEEANETADGADDDDTPEAAPNSDQVEAGEVGTTAGEPDTQPGAHADTDVGTLTNGLSTQHESIDSAAATLLAKPIDTAPAGAKVKHSVDQQCEEKPDSGLLPASKDETEGRAGKAADISANEQGEGEDQGHCYACDGPCFKGIPHSTTWYRCSYCIADFCEACHGLITTKRLSSFYICGHDHEFVTIPPVEQFPKEMIKVGDEFVPITIWLDRLADDWGIPRRPQTTADGGQETNV